MPQATLDQPEQQDAARQPFTGAERLVTLDFIRGVAVLGILFANIVAFAEPTAAYYWPPAMVGGDTAADGWFWVFQFVLVDGKFRGLFTVLFGAGIVLFTDRAGARGDGPVLQLRRLAWLLVFGLAHYFLVWRGDILTLYAVWGMIALFGVRMPDAKLLSVGISMYLFGSLVMCALLAPRYLEASGIAGLGAGNPGSADLIEGPAEMLQRAHAEATLYAGGSWIAIVREGLADAGLLLQELVLVGTTETIGLLFIGMGLYRFRFFHGAIDTATMRRWGWAGLLVGGVPSIAVALWVRSDGFAFYHTLFAFNGLGALLHLPMILGLTALLVGAAPRATQRRLGTRLAAAGRMAFSNYLGTSLAMAALFQGWAGGLYGRFHRVELLAVVVLAWAVMLVWSKWWLGRFQYGPLEWVWRCLTYGRLLAFRRVA